jgi:hypothetical protein
MSEAKNKYILNLVEELSDSLKSYFKKNSFELLTRDQASNYAEIDYIIVETSQEVKVASKDFNADENEISIVCLGIIKEMREFLLYNGRLTIDPIFAENALGEQVLNKFFHKNYNIHLDESFSKLFEEANEFKITNHLSAGIYVDELCVNAFEKGFNIVALRSFMDHSILYFTYLKQAGLAGVPYEVEYSNNDDFFVVNIYLPVRNFVAEYMIDSFGPVNSKDPIQYLLGVVSRSTDFLEITYVENPGRLVLTAAWSKSEKNKIGGLAFNNILTTAQNNTQLDRKLKEYKEVEVDFQEIEAKEETLLPKDLPGGFLDKTVSKYPDLVKFTIAIFPDKFADESIDDIDIDQLNHILKSYDNQSVIEKLTAEDKEDILVKIRKNNISEAYGEELERVRDNLEDDESHTETLQSTMTEEVSKRVAGQLDAEAINKILGGKDEDQWQTKIGGEKEDPDDFVTKIGGMDKKKDGPFAQMISSSFEKKAGEFNVKISNSTDPNDKKGMMRNMISSTVDDIDSFDSNSMSLSIKKFAAKNVPKDIELGMEEYAAKMGKTFENLSKEEIEKFQKEVLPTIIEKTLSDNNKIEEFKSSLEKESLELASMNTGNMTPEFEVKFKTNLEKKLSSLDFVEKVGDKFVITNDQVGDNKMQELIQETMKETMDEEFKLEKGSKAEIEIQEKRMIENLSSSFNVDKEEMTQLVQDGAQVAKDLELNAVVGSLQESKAGDKEAANLAESELIKKLKKSEFDKNKLENNVKMLEAKLLAQTQSQNKINDINELSSSNVDSELEKNSSESEFASTGELDQNVEALLEDMESGKDIGDSGRDAIKALYAREKMILDKAKVIEIDLKKAQIEINQKEILFKSEIDKSNRAIKGKDLVVEKVKESMKTLINKKDKENSGLVTQLEDLNKRLNNDSSTKLVSQVKSLQSDNERLAKSAEMFKSKLDSFSKAKLAQEEADNSKEISDNLRALKSEKNQLENKVKAIEKESKTLEARFDRSKELEVKFRIENTQLKTDALELEAKAKEVDNLKSRNVQLQTKLKELVAKQKNVASGSGPSSGLQSKKEKYLENEKKGLQAQVTKAAVKLEENKKDMMKMKGEQTKLQNEVTKLKKDLERAAAAAKASSASKKAA